MGAQFIEPSFKHRFIGRKSIASSDELLRRISQADELYKDISQFVGESEWDSQTVAMIRKGLVDLKAFQHLELFDDGGGHCCRHRSRGTATVHQYTPTQFQRPSS